MRSPGRVITSDAGLLPAAHNGGSHRKLHSDHSRRKLLEECEHLLASQLFPQKRLLGGVHSVILPGREADRSSRRASARPLCERKSRISLQMCLTRFLVVINNDGGIAGDQMAWSLG
jgi:hypothetical protein